MYPGVRAADEERSRRLSLLHLLPPHGLQRLLAASTACACVRVCPAESKMTSLIRSDLIHVSP